MARALVVGGGAWGAAAALALAGRGRHVTLIDPSGPTPHPLAESTDISKVVRMDYGADADYTALMETALDGWRRWNREWDEDLYHETGVVFLTRAPMAPGGFEHDSWATLTARGHWLDRLDGNAIARRFPAWNARAYIDGYYNPRGGYAESGRVVARLLAQAAASGVTIVSARVVRLDERGGRVSGVVDDRGARIEADEIVVAAGSWTPHLLPSLAGCMRSVGQPVFHLRPSDPERFAAGRFPVFGADIARTGYYGFPSNREGIVKIANHGPGRAMHPEGAERAVNPEEERALRAFLAETFPALAGEPITATRVCVYCDTRDEHFWIARDPAREGLVVAAGGSGHGFKFAPVIGDLIADAVDGTANPRLHKFRWRPEIAPTVGEEAARHHRSRR